MRTMKRFKSEGPPQTSGLGTDFIINRSDFIKTSKKLTKSKSIVGKTGKRPSIMKSPLNVTDVLGSLYIQTPSGSEEHLSTNYYFGGIENRISLYLQTKIDIMICEVAKEINEIIETTDPLYTIVDPFVKGLLEELRFEIKLETSSIDMNVDSVIDEFNKPIRNAVKEQKHMKMIKHEQIGLFIPPFRNNKQNMINALTNGFHEFSSAINSLEKRRGKIKKLQKKYLRRDRKIYDAIALLEMEKNSLDAEIETIISRIKSISILNRIISIEPPDERKTILKDLSEISNIVNRANDKFIAHEAVPDNFYIREQIRKMYSDLIYCFHNH